MAIHTPLRAIIRGAIAVLAGAYMSYAAAFAASPEPDHVSLSESTIGWSSVKYATDTDNGFVRGSLDKSVIVVKTRRHDEGLHGTRALG